MLTRCHYWGSVRPGFCPAPLDPTVEQFPMYAVTLGSRKPRTRKLFATWPKPRCQLAEGLRVDRGAGEKKADAHRSGRSDEQGGDSRRAESAVSRLPLAVVDFLGKGSDDKYDSPGTDRSTPPVEL